MAQAAAFKYQNFLSRRKFNFMCKTQSSVFDPNNEVRGYQEMLSV